MNCYFRIVGGRGFQVYRHLGCSESNTYIGASRVTETVMEAVNLREGDEVHAVAGGTFMVSDGVVSPISLRPPKHIFEKSYLPPPSAAETLRRHAARGTATEIAAPARDPGYAAARDRVAGNRLRPFHPQIVHVDDSPELTALTEVAEGFAAASGGWSIRKADHTAHAGPTVRLERDGTRLTLAAGAHGVVSVEIPKSLEIYGPKAPIEIGEHKTFHFRTVDGVADPLSAARTFLAACGEALAPAAGPRM